MKVNDIGDGQVLLTYKRMLKGQQEEDAYNNHEVLTAKVLAGLKGRYYCSCRTIFGASLISDSYERILPNTRPGY